MQRTSRRTPDTVRPQIWKATRYFPVPDQHNQSAEERSLRTQNASASLTNLRVFDLLNSGTLVHKASSRNAEVDTFSVNTPQGRSLVAVKHTRVDGQSAKESIREEFTTLQHLQEILGEPLRRTVPRPLLLLEDEGTIAFSFVPGVPLDVMLRRGANTLTASADNVIGRRRLEVCGYHVGAWLKMFHAATAMPDQTFDQELFCLELDSRMAKWQRLGCPASPLAAVRDLAVTLSATLSRCAVPTAAVHGDFLPQNVLF